MCTNRLYKAIKERLDAEDANKAACFNGNYSPPKRLNHNDPVALRWREANEELREAMEEAGRIINAPIDRSRQVAIRISGERDIARFLLKSLIEQGYEVGGNDGEVEVVATTDYKDVVAQAFETDMYYINVNKEGLFLGSIMLVYGNSPEEMISDYHMAIESLLKPTFEYIKKFYDPTYIIPEGEEHGTA